MYLNMVVQHWALFGKLAIIVEDFYVKIIGLGLKKSHAFDHETRKSGVFQCYGLKMNDFLSSYNQNLKIRHFHTHLCSKFLATAKVGLAHYDSFRGGGLHMHADRTYRHSGSFYSNNYCRVCRRRMRQCNIRLCHVPLRVSSFFKLPYFRVR